MINAAASQFVGRESELDQLKTLITKFVAAPATQTGLQIVSIAGSGGVGKSYLLDTVLQDSRAQLMQALLVKLDASNEHLLKEFTLIVDQMLAPIELPPPAKAKHDYFPATRSLLRRQLQLIGMVETEISNNKDLSDQGKAVAKLLYRLSPAVKYIPKVGPALAIALKGMETAKAEEYIEPALDAISKLNALNDKAGIFANPLTKRRFTALRHSPFEAISDAYLSDLSAILQSYRKKDRFHLTHEAIQGLNRFILIIDDFEAVGRVIGTFLVEALLPRLKNASFASLVIILGRDSVYEAHKDFAHHLAGNLCEPMRLEPFSEREGVKYLMGAGYTEGEAREWFEKSRGLPFVLRLLAENRTDEAKQSALFFKRFYERTTRWMAPEERKWLIPICYLDKVNEGTLKISFPREDSSIIMAWFENEASVRDVKSGSYTVTPYIKHMLLEYNRRKVGDAEHARLIENAKRAMQEA